MAISPAEPPQPPPPIAIETKSALKKKESYQIPSLSKELNLEQDIHRFDIPQLKKTTRKVPWASKPKSPAERSALSPIASHLE